MSTDTTTPKNTPASGMPTSGHWLEVDGKIKSQYATSDAALKIGLELKRKFPNLQVNVFDAKEYARTLVELPEDLKKQTEAAGDDAAPVTRKSKTAGV